MKIVWMVVVATTLFLAVASAERVKDEDFAVIESLERALIMEALNKEVAQASDILQRAFLMRGQSFPEIGREQGKYKPKKKEVKKPKVNLKPTKKKPTKKKPVKPKAPKKKKGKYRKFSRHKIFAIFEE